MLTEKRKQQLRKFAGETKPSMLRRSDYRDYTLPGYYLLTLTIEGRRPLLGALAGCSDANADSPDAPRIELTALGKAVEDEWRSIPDHYPQVVIIALQLMPDHLHAIIYVREQLSVHLGVIVRGFKSGCNRHLRRLLPELASQLTATQSQSTPHGHRTTHGLLWSHGYNDRLLHSDIALETWVAYVKDNPRRLAIRREHRDFFTVRFGVTVGSMTYAAIGNRQLLSYPDRVQVQLSRHLNEHELAWRQEELLQRAREGAVLVSPAISKGEQQVMRAALDEGLSQVFLTPWGFDEFSKPGHQYYEACAQGRLLILAPWPHQNRRPALTRDMCLALNAMTEELCR